MSLNSATGASDHSDAQGALRARFEKHPVADLASLRRTLRASRRTVFRVLKKVGYHSSYSHAGGYYTLLGIPSFDAHGVWFCRDVGFSKHGTLRATVELLVKEAPAGHTHEELQVVLRLRVHDTLRSLVEGGRIAREEVQSLYVYVSPLPDAARAQLARRRALEVPSAGSPSAPPLDSARVIDVLLAVIHGPRASARKIATDLRARGLGVTDAQVEDLFARYGLGKKTARSRSRRSRR
jgi:hypothetical protein